jgi:hypothetical protein
VLGAKAPLVCWRKSPNSRTQVAQSSIRSRRSCAPRYRTRSRNDEPVPAGDPTGPGTYSCTVRCFASILGRSIRRCFDPFTKSRQSRSSWCVANSWRRQSASSVPRPQPLSRRGPTLFADRRHCDLQWRPSEEALVAETLLQDSEESPQRRSVSFRGWSNGSEKASRAVTPGGSRTDEERKP